MIVLLSSCSKKLPTNLDQSKGIAAIPLEIKNTSRESRIPFEYNLIDYKTQTTCATITPSSNQQFIFTKELPPGDYQIYKVRRVFASDAGIADSHVDEKSLFKSISFKIKSGKITIADMKFKIHQSQQDNDRFNTQYDVGFLMNKEREDFANKLKRYNNSQYWDIIY